MKRFVIISSVGLALLCGCGRKNVAPEQVKVPRTAVTVTNAVAGNIDNCIKLPATTAYLDKSVVSSPIPAFVVSSSVQPGTRVRRGETLYTLESKERRAMGNDGAGGLVCLKAEHDGVVVEVMQRSGSFVPEGCVLCTVAESGSLVFEIKLPYEMTGAIRARKRLTIRMPDGTAMPTAIVSELVTMDTASQATRLIAKVGSAPFLPEGLNATAEFREQTRQEGLLRSKGGRPERRATQRTLNNEGRRRQHCRQSARKAHRQRRLTGGNRRRLHQQGGQDNPHGRLRT